ncbi:MAG: TonB-dependent receptor [Bacteroidota bacterium]
MRNTILLNFFIVFGIGFATAQTGSISGKVVEKGNNPVPNVNISILGTVLGTTTDTKGNYTITNLEAGNYILKFSSLGYSIREQKVVVISGQPTVLDITLSRKEENLDEVVVEGRRNLFTVREPSESLRLKTELVKLPQNIQVISNALLQDQQVTSIMEGTIRNVSGVTMLEHWGHFARVHMRGFRIPAFRNGFNFDDSWGPLAEDFNNVERIEFIKGPAGFTISAGEPGGFYNVVTKKPTESFITSVNAIGGSFDFYRGAVDVSGKLSENGKLLGRFNAAYQTGDTHRGNEQSIRYSINPTVTYNFSERTSVNAELNLNQAEVFIGSAYVFAPASRGFGSLDRDFRFVDTNYPESDIEEMTFFGTFNHAFSDNWSITGKFSYLRYDQVGSSAWVFDPDGTDGPLGPVNENGDVFRYTNIWDALSVGKYVQAYTNVAFNTAGVQHKVLGAFDFTEKEYWADFSQFAPVDTTAPFNIFNPVYGNGTPANFDRSIALRDRPGNFNYGFRNRSAYVQDEIGFFEGKARLTLAARYTNITTFELNQEDDKFTPRIGLSVDILPSLTAYGLYDQSFIPQSALGSDNGVDAFAITDPEEASDIEGGLKKSFLEGKLRTSLGVYLITKENIVVADPRFPNGNFSILLGEVQSKGIEFDLQGQITPELNVVLNYANTNVEITEDSNPDNVGDRIAGHARHMTNGWFNYVFNEKTTLKGFGASLGYQYQIDRSTWNWGADNESQLPDYFRLDGALSWRNNNIRVQLNVNNILNEFLYSGSDFADFLYWQSEPGINGRLGITYTF